jgi:hypothetical protein
LRIIGFPPGLAMIKVATELDPGGRRRPEGGQNGSG